MAIFTSVSPDQKQFEAFYLAYRDKLYRLCRSFCPQEADAADLFQEILLQIWTALPSFRGEAQLSTWAYRIAVNKATSFRKQAVKRQAPPLIQELLVSAVDQEEEDPRLFRLRRAIAELKPIDRLLVTLQLEGLKYEEMAKISGLNTNQLGLRLHRAKLKLQKKMLKHGS